MQTSQKEQSDIIEVKLEVGGFPVKLIEGKDL
jgi:hypothetical protein